MIIQAEAIKAGDQIILKSGGLRELVIIKNVLISRDKADGQLWFECIDYPTITLHKTEEVEVFHLAK